MAKKKKQPETHFDLEAVYDAEIAPLMTQIIAVCKKHDMPMLATFCYKSDEDGDSLCTTVLPRGKRQAEAIRRAFKEIKRRETFTAFAITTKPLEAE